jgi:hypothetical protein
LLACRATLKGHRENTAHASLIQNGRGLQESLSRVLSVWREVRRDERQEPADWRLTREGFVAIKGRAKRFAPTAASATAARIAQISDCRRGVRPGVRN